MGLVRFAVVTAIVCAACDDADTPYIIDLEGPHGRALAPGPWPVAVLASDDTPQLMWAVDDGPFEPLELRADGDRFVGALPDQPLGTTLRYFARVADDIEPANPRTAEVVVPAAPPDMAVDPGRCALAFRHPRDRAELTPADDDSAPQAGLQLTVVVETNLADGVAARLTVGGVRYSGESGAGAIAFDDVTLAAGEQTLMADAVAPGGQPCEATITVRASAPAPP